MVFYCVDWNIQSLKIDLKFLFFDGLKKNDFFLWFCGMRFLTWPWIIIITIFEARKWYFLNWRSNDNDGWEMILVCIKIIFVLKFLVGKWIERNSNSESYVRNIGQVGWEPHHIDVKFLYSYFNVSDQFECSLNQLKTHRHFNYFFLYFSQLKLNAIWIKMSGWMTNNHWLLNSDN